MNENEKLIYDLLLDGETMKETVTTIHIALEEGLLMVENPNSSFMWNGNDTISGTYTFKKA